MQCDICKDPIKGVEGPRKAHLLVVKQADGHIHTHGDIHQKENVKEMLDAAAEDCGVAIAGKQSLADMKEVVFHNRQRIGDMLMFTCGVRDFKAAFPHVKVNVISIAQHIWDHNPNLDRSVVATEQNTVKIGPTRLTNASNRLDWHFANAFRVSIEDALKVSIPQGESRPDIYLTEEEYNAPRLFNHPYWIICLTGEKGWGCKMYPFNKWQQFVSENPETIFVQIGSSEDNPPRLKGSNVIDYVGKTQSKETGIRDLFKLFLNAEGSIGLVSFHMHLSGALYKPCIVVAGGREPVSFTRYPGHAYLSTDGMLPCSKTACWHCSIDACTNLVLHPNAVEEHDRKVPKCNDMIEPADLTRAMEGYYKGGRLKKGVPSEKPKFKNIVKTPPKPVPPPPVNTYGMTFGGGSLTEEDWKFIQKTIKDHKIKTVLEFGAGLSTLLLADSGVQLETLECHDGWIKKLKAIKPDLNIQQWDGEALSLPTGKEYDLVFVDGPAGDKARDLSTQAAAMYGKIIIVHDAGREWARKYQDEYIKPHFDGPGKGGHRCHLWVRKVNSEAIVENRPYKPLQESIVAANPKCKFVKIVSTARGWGGCARSITTIMDLLLKAGHKVEFIPFRNAVTSSEMKSYLAGNANIKVTENYNTLNEGCDCLLMYADDYIWEFGNSQLAEAFSNIAAERKIMMLNYRRGKVGEIPWTRGWDKYMFLNSTQERELLKVHPGVKTKVLPPCTNLAPFLEVKPDYNHSLRLIRHSSQGDTKYPKDFNVMVDMMRFRQPLELHLLPAPSFLEPKPFIHTYQRTADPAGIAAFLAKGNCFWYSLPEGYMDMGPRVILEAMAAGLPVIADAWGGAVDRVTEETGWLFDEKIKHVDILPHLTPEILQKKGEAAKARAAAEFVPERWLQELLT